MFPGKVCLLKGSPWTLLDTAEFAGLRRNHGKGDVVDYLDKL
jgi:hypothetical protein